MPYTEDDAPLFFGRDEWRDIIIDNLRAYRLTLLYGPSGVGKSSVLRAGVVHELRERASRNKRRSGLPGHAVAIVRAWRGDSLDQLITCVDSSVDGLPEVAGPGELAETREVLPGPPSHRHLRSSWTSSQRSSGWCRRWIDVRGAQAAECS